MSKLYAVIVIKDFITESLNDNKYKEVKMETIGEEKPIEKRKRGRPKGSLGKKTLESIKNLNDGLKIAENPTQNGQP